MTAVFDLDGVILDSNGAKSQAFYQAALPYGEDAAEWMVAYHQRAGSITRRARVEALFADYLCVPEVADSEIESVLDAIAETLSEAYDAAPLVPGVEAMLTQPGRKVVVSGVEEIELRAILWSRGLAQHFDGIYGGNKHEILPRLVTEGVITLPATYYGDTEDDYHAATRAGLDFVLVAGCSEWETWREHPCAATAIEDFRALRQPRRVYVNRDGYTEAGEYVGRHLAGAVVTR